MCKFLLRPAQLPADSRIIGTRRAPGPAGNGTSGEAEQRSGSRLRSDAPVGPAPGVEAAHLRAAQLEAGHVRIRPDALSPRRPRHYDDAVLEVPADDDLSRAPAVPLRNLHQHRIVQIGAPEGGVALEDDSPRQVALPDPSVEEEGVPADLVHRGHDPRAPGELVKALEREVAHPDGAGQPSVADLDQPSPGLEPGAVLLDRKSTRLNSSHL